MKPLPFVLALAVLWPAVVNAQPPRPRLPPPPPGSFAQRDERIARVIRDCEDRTNDFLRATERAWGRDRHANDVLDRSAARLERALNRIRDSWNRDRDYRRTRGNVGAAISAGREVNRVMRTHRLAPRLEREWVAIRNELNNLAEAFEQPRIRW